MLTSLLSAMTRQIAFTHHKIYEQRSTLCSIYNIQPSGIGKIVHVKVDIIDNVLNVCVCVIHSLNMWL